MTDLIDLDRAKAQINNFNGDEAALAAMITAASGVIENYCRRKFGQNTYDELYTVAGSTGSLFVANPPIVQINQLRAGRLPAIYLQCLNPLSQVQQATAEVTDTAVILVRIYNAVTTTSTFSFADYPTFTALGAAVNSTLSADGWIATVPQQFALWQTSDMVPQGPFNCRAATSALTVYWWGLVSGFQINHDLGEIYNPTGFLSGYQYYRIQYVGGFDPIPEEIQYATASLVQLMYASRTANPLMTSETIDKYTYSRTATANLDNLGTAAKLALNSYKLLKVARYK